MDNLLKEAQARLKLFKHYGYDIPRARNFILAKAELGKGRLLEVGTGRGHLALALARKGFKFISVDLDKKAQRAAGVSLKALGLERSASLKIMNAEKLRFPDDYFNSVISVNFIHHAKNPLKCLKEMLRVTKEKLIIADLNKRGQKIMEKVHALDGHEHAPSQMSLSGVKEYLRRAGLRVRVYRDVCQTVIIAGKNTRRVSPAYRQAGFLLHPTLKSTLP
ncbi:MAG: class I SAM-dependent methyltransferase [Candidatus Omnitrophota bacterium]